MNRIRELRKQKKLTQKELAKHLQIADSTLSYWEMGKYEPDNKSLKILSKFFHVPIDYILGGEISEWIKYRKSIDPAVNEAEVKYESHHKNSMLNHKVFEDLTPEEIDKLIEYAEFIKNIALCL